MHNTQDIIKDLVLWVQKSVNKAKAKGLVFGLSGGIDSAVMAGLSKIAFPETSLGLIMPCHSDSLDEEHGLIIADTLDLEVKKIDLTNTFDSLVDISNIDIENHMAMANIKPRLRMTTLYYFAQSYNYLVAGSSNKSEFTTGYFTKHGDSGVDILPLANFIKEEIWELARALNIPEIIIEKKPSAGLWEGQSDEDEMGFSYDILDNYIKMGKGPEPIVERIRNMNERSLHKRQFPPIYKHDASKFYIDLESKKE